MSARHEAAEALMRGVLIWGAVGVVLTLCAIGAQFYFYGGW